MIGFLRFRRNFSIGYLDQCWQDAIDRYINSSSGDTFIQKTASSSSELEALVASSTQNTHIILQSGTYGNMTLQNDNNVNIVIEGVNNPILNGMVEIKDNITLKKLVVNGGSERNYSIYINGSDSKVIGCIFNNPLSTYWIKLSETSYRAELAYNVFKNRPADLNGLSTQKCICSFHNDSITEPIAHHIHHNYFKDIAKHSGYGEMYLAYTNNPSLEYDAPFAPDQNIIFEYNLFDNANGDGRAADIKTNGVTLRYNTFINGSGPYLILRNAKNSKVHDNIWIGGNSYGGGISINHKNNMVYNNYIQNTSPVENTRAIQLFVGADEADGVTKKQLVNCKIFNNTIIGAYQAIDLGIASDNAHKPILDSLIVNNIILNSTYVFYGDTAPENSIISNNFYENCNYNQFPDYATETNIELIDYLGNGVLHPTSNSNITDAGTTTGDILLIAPRGIEKTTRHSVPSCGATEVGSNETRSCILTPADVGVDATNEQPNNDTGDNNYYISDYYPKLKSLPPQSEWVDVTQHGVVGDGTTDNTAALNNLGQDTTITNWYFPDGKYLMKDISIPSHVRAVFGNGYRKTKIIAKANCDNTYGYALGAIKINKEINEGLIIDGITFESEDKPMNGDIPVEDYDTNLWPHGVPGYVGPSGPAWRWYGLITIDGNIPLNNLNIRNCKFDTTNFKLNCIKVFGGSLDNSKTRLNKNMIINNNYFTGFWQFGLEIIAVDKPSDGSHRTIVGFRVFNNEFNCPAGGFPFSIINIMANDPGTNIPTDGTENRIFNNKVYGKPVWFIEHSSNNGLLVYNNEAIGVTKKMVSGRQGDLIDALGYNEFFENHLTCTHEFGVESAMEWCNVDKLYNNYIDSAININEFADTENINRFGEICNNTLVYSNESDDGWSGHINVRNSTSGSIHNNVLYSGSKASKCIDFGSSVSGNGNKCYENIIYMKNPNGLCVKKIYDNIDDHDNICNLGWNGSYPTYREGAGLKYPDYIGPDVDFVSEGIANENDFEGIVNYIRNHIEENRNKLQEFINSNIDVRSYGYEVHVGENETYTTIQAAIDHVSEYINNNGLPDNGICIYVDSGTYSSFVIPSTLKGTYSKPIHIRKKDNAIVKLTPAFKITGFNKITSSDPNYNRFDASVRDSIYVTDLSDYNLGSWNYKADPHGMAPAEVIENLTMMNLGRWPRKNQHTTDLIANSSNVVVTNTTALSHNVAGTYINEKTGLDAIYRKDSTYSFSRRLSGRKMPSWRFSENNTLLDWASEKSGVGLPRDFYKRSDDVAGEPRLLTKGDFQFGHATIRKGINSTEWEFFEDEPIGNWEVTSGENALWAAGYWNMDYDSRHAKIVDINPSTRRVKFEEAPVYSIKTGGYPMPYFIYNILEEVKEPGDYYIDRVNKKLYIIPTGNIAQNTYWLTYGDYVVKFDGCEHVIVEGFNIFGSRGKTVEFTSETTDSVIRRCKISNTGNNAAVIDGYRNGIEYCDISQTANTAIRLYGGIRASITKSNNFVKNCHIHDSSRWVWMYHGAIGINGTGMIVENNDIHGFYGDVIQYLGNEHTIRYNAIWDNLKFCGDMGMIYSGRNWAFQGVKIENNYFGDSKPVYGGEYLAAVYLDDGLAGTTVKKNIFANLDMGGIFANGGHSNKMENNIFYKTDMVLRGSYIPWVRYSTTSGSSWNLLEKLYQYGVDYKAEPWASAYPELAQMPNDHDQLKNGGWLWMKNCTWKNNISIDEEIFTVEINDALIYDKFEEYQDTPYRTIPDNWEDIDYENIGINI